MTEINWLAVIVASVSAFALGAVWYAPPVFGSAWMRANGFVKETMKGHSPGITFGLAFVLTFVISLSMAVYLTHHVNTYDMHTSLLTGFGAGLWIFCGIGIVSLFEARSLTYVLINGGYSFFMAGLIGLILGLWA